ncbi:hypothetical protein HTV45_18655 [Streptomyces sp. CHD11]|uniref:hypothetical protein n=1 Tax=Streptomyces sp. CHD11 TaxID=2741325 RepID=UPI001BFC6914|nr:hypothetical protein [Streptomyces sp. CHD11]MBT3152870.1 hypothetical protein [Streptomyces sp. CHD11]
MLALRLSLGAHPAVQLRRLLVAAASAGTGFLLLSALGHALGHPDPSVSALRLAWCAAPLAATVYFAVAVARTDPATRPRPGLSAIGLGPARLMLISALTTALSCLLGSALALLAFLQLRGDLTGMPLVGAATDFLAAGRPLPLPAALTLLALVPLSASAAVAVVLRPREPVPGAPRGVRAYGRFGAYRRTAALESFGAYGRFGKQLAAPPRVRHTAGAAAGRGGPAAPELNRTAALEQNGVTAPERHGAVALKQGGTTAPERDGAAAPGRDGAVGAPGSADESGTAAGPGGVEGSRAGTVTGTPPALAHAAPSGLPWGITVLAVGLAVEAFASRSDTGSPGDRPAALLGLALACVGLALAGPGLTHLCGRLLQTARPGALRLLAGRVLMTEAARIGRPLGVVCAVMSAVYAMASLHEREDASSGPLVALGVLLVAGCTVATLFTAAVESRQARADTTAALRLLGAPGVTLRRAAVLRAGALLALFGPLSLLVAELSAWPLTG